MAVQFLPEIRMKIITNLPACEHPNNPQNFEVMTLIKPYNNKRNFSQLPNSDCNFHIGTRPNTTKEIRIGGIENVIYCQIKEKLFSTKA